MQLALEIVQPSAKLITPPEWFDGMIKIAEYAGRLSHKTEDKQTQESAAVFLRKWCIEGKTEQTRHESILEHAAQITFHFVMSRAASHQLVRHRLCAYTQESQRYCDYSKPRFGNTLRVILPPSCIPDGALPAGTLVTAQMDMSNDDVDYQLVYPDGSTDSIGAPGEAFRYWATSIIRSYGRYLWLCKEHHIPAEDSRFLLPNAAKTEIITTANARQWLHMGRMRLDKHAQWEIRHVMGIAFDELFKHMPIVFDNEETRALRSGQ
jgi:thymidylate synthase (FAD)